MRMRLIKQRLARAEPGGSLFGGEDWKKAYTEDVGWLMKKRTRIGCLAVVERGGLMVGIQCSKGRGITFPGGKVERGETFAECAVRELREETGLHAERVAYLHGGMSPDGNYCYAFRCGVEKYDPTSGREGQVGLYGWNDFLKSDFRAYYEILRAVMRRES